MAILSFWSCVSAIEQGSQCHWISKGLFCSYAAERTWRRWIIVSRIWVLIYEQQEWAWNGYGELWMICGCLARVRIVTSYYPQTIHRRPLSSSRKRTWPMVHHSYYYYLLVITYWNTGNTTVILNNDFMNQLIVYYFSIIVVYYFLLLERCNNSSNGANIQILHSTTPNDILEALF